MLFTRSYCGYLQVYLGGALVTTGLGKVCRCPPDNVEGKHLKKAGIDAGRGGELRPMCYCTSTPVGNVSSGIIARRRVFRGTQNVQRVTDDQSAALAPSADQK